MVVFSVTLFSIFKSDKFSPIDGFSSKIDFVKCQLQFLHCWLKFELLLSTQPGGFSYNCTKTAVVTLSRWYHALSSNKYFHIAEDFQMPRKLLLQHRGKSGLPLSQVHRISWSETSNTQFVIRPLKIYFVSRPNIDDCDFLQWKVPGWFLLPQRCSNPDIECLHQGRNHPYEQRGDRKNYPSRSSKLYNRWEASWLLHGSRLPSFALCGMGPLDQLWLFGTRWLENTNELDTNSMNFKLLTTMICLAIRVCYVPWYNSSALQVPPYYIPDTGRINWKFSISDFELFFNLTSPYLARKSMKTILARTCLSFKRCA